MQKSDMFCEDFGAAEASHSKDAREIPICGIPASIGKCGDDTRGGSYITLFCGDIAADGSRGIAEAVAESINILASPLLPKPPRSVLVAAFGNGSVMCDSLGSRVADRLLVTGCFPSESLPATFALRTGVPAGVGLESHEAVSIFAERLSPELILCVDSLAAALPQRLGRAIQLTDAGIAPGSGVAPHTVAVTSRLTGVPTVGIGVPTVIRQGKALLTDAKLDTSLPRIASSLSGGINLYFTKYCRQSL